MSPSIISAGRISCVTQSGPAISRPASPAGRAIRHWSRANPVVTSGWPLTDTKGLTTAGTQTNYGLQRRGSSVNETLVTNATLPFTGTKVRIQYAKAGRANANPGFRVVIDGGTPVDIHTEAAPATGGNPVTADGFSWDSPALAAGAHTLSITPIPGSGQTAP